MPDCWTAIQVDSALMCFGITMENWLAERDEKGNPKYELSVLLEPTPTLLTEADMRAHNQKILNRRKHLT